MKKIRNRSVDLAYPANRLMKCMDNKHIHTRVRQPGNVYRIYIYRPLPPRSATTAGSVDQILATGFTGIKDTQKKALKALVFPKPYPGRAAWSKCSHGALMSAIGPCCSALLTPSHSFGRRRYGSRIDHVWMVYR
jgi:hypothetical protein